MNGPDRKPTPPDDDFEPLTPALEEWFGKKFSELPAEVQERITRVRGPGMLALLWDVISPRRQRNMAREYDIEHHPGLDHARNALWKKTLEIAECERTASNIPVENRPMTDVQLQETRLRKLRKEETVIEAALQQKAKALGLERPDDWDSIIPANVGEKSRADTEKGTTSKGGAPPRADRDDFDREVVRRLALDGGDISLTQFRKGMKQWASDEMDPTPDDRTVERWIKRLVPRGLLAD